MTGRSSRALTLPLLTLLASGLAGCNFAEKAKEGVENINDASSVACSRERQLFQTAVESYMLLENQDIAVEAMMVPDYLRAESPLYDIDAAGNIVPQPGGGCD